ncbi:MAG: alpha/beta hydrolase [Bacteroidaceae bacterium]|nr:alpha/beta hydrolase [Bacteroidaceae bacterium]
MEISRVMVLAAALVLCGGLQAKETESRTFDNGGSGDYKAIMVGDESLPTHTIFRPQDLSQFSKSNPLPVLVWGNGGCANSPSGHINFLNEIASQGFIVIAIGPMPTGQGGGFGGGMGGGNRPQGAQSQLLDALDWITAQNADKTSQYYGKIDLKNVAAAGMSCGGLQAYQVSADPRIKTVMICNSGLFNNGGGSMMGGMPNIPKEDLNKIKVPMLYILGGPTDIAYENGMDDFKRLEKIPAFVCNFNVGHGGTYTNPNGGEFGIVACAWLKWQLKGNQEAGTLFTGSPCGLSLREGWTTDKKNIP